MDGEVVVSLCLSAGAFSVAAATFLRDSLLRKPRLRLDVNTGMAFSGDGPVVKDLLIVAVVNTGQVDVKLMQFGAIPDPRWLRKKPRQGNQLVYIPHPAILGNRTEMPCWLKPRDGVTLQVSPLANLDFDLVGSIWWVKDSTGRLFYSKRVKAKDEEKELSTTAEEGELAEEGEGE